MATLVRYQALVIGRVRPELVIELMTGDWQTVTDQAEWRCVFPWNFRVAITSILNWKVYYASYIWGRSLFLLKMCIHWPCLRNRQTLAGGCSRALTLRLFQTGPCQRRQRSNVYNDQTQDTNLVFILLSNLQTFLRFCQSSNQCPLEQKRTSFSGLEPSRRWHAALSRHFPTVSVRLERTSVLVSLTLSLLQSTGQVPGRIFPNRGMLFPRD